MFLSSLGNLKNYGKYNLYNPSNFVYSNINSKNKNNLSYHGELMLSNKYIKMLAEKDEKSRIIRHLLAGEPETKKPSLLSLVVVASLLSVSFYFYSRGAIIINS
jgi:hypothetical protein